MPSIGAARTSLMSPGHAEASRSFDTLLRYHGGTFAEFSRALRTLQAEAPHVREAAAAPQARGDICKRPIEPEDRRNPDEIPSAPAADEAQASDRRDAAAGREAERSILARACGCRRTRSQSNPKPAGILTKSRRGPSPNTTRTLQARATRMPSLPCDQGPLRGVFAP
jgi:hypothetical protein